VLPLAAQELILDSDFNKGTQSWSPSASGTFDFNATGEAVSSTAVKVTGRLNDADSVVQLRSATSIVPALNPAGEPYRVKARIKVEGHAYVRVTLQFIRTGSTGLVQRDTKIILAEAIARPPLTGPTNWIDVEGVRLVKAPVNFVAQQAEITVEVGQVYKEVLLQSGNNQPIFLPTPTDKWPDFTLDSISMQRDGDLDGLTDAEELAAIPATYIDDADSDHDEMSDAWEKSMGLLPRDPSDADLDPDHDGYTNVQEYWCATDPRDTPEGRASHPGVTSNPNATPAAKRLAIWLALAPWRKERILGQHITTLPYDYDHYVVALANQVQQQTGTERWPAILSVAVEGPATAMDIVQSGSYARAYVQSGGLALVKWAMWNPWTGGNMGSQGIGQVDVLGLTKNTHPTYNGPANVAARAVLNGWMDSIATELNHFIDPNFGGHPDNVVMFRLCSEMTGNWFWFGHRTIEEYTSLWAYVYNYLTITKGLNHLLWVYESAQTEHSYKTPTANFKPVPADYPGDAFVDVMGHNLYDDDWDLTHDLDRLYRRYPKIYAVPQAGPSQNAGAKIDNLVIFQRIETAFPRLSFYIPWNTFPSGTNSFVYNATIDNDNVYAIMTHTRIITRDEVQWMTGWQQFAHDTFGTLAAPPDADTDADGLTDIFEYALGSDPLTGTDGNSITLLPNSGGGLKIQFSRAPGTFGLDMNVEASDDLTNWQSIAAATDTAAWSTIQGVTLTQQDAPGAPSTVTVTDSIPIGSVASRFLRLRIDAQP
jgi:mannan endo-1,4-beta-mannosidase